MASGAVSGAIENYLVANWTATLLVLENKSAAEDGTPAGIPVPPNTPAPMVQVSFTGRAYGQASIGASVQSENRWDEEGVLLLDVMVPIGSGSTEARTYAKSLCDLFRGLTTLLGGNLEFQDATIGEGTKSDKYEGNYFSIPVDIDWRRVEA
jgi:hypothetical protein